MTLFVFAIPFVMCGNKHVPYTINNKAAQTDKVFYSRVLDTVSYAGKCNSWANPFGIDTFFLDTIRYVRVTNDSILFMVNDLYFDFTESTKHFYIHKYKFALNDSGVYQWDFSKKDDIAIFRFHLLKDDSIHFYREETYSKRMQFGILAKKIPKR